MSSDKFMQVIHAPSEWVQGGAGFWSNDSGWVALEHATRFSGDDARNANLPFSGLQDARWMTCAEAEAKEAARSEFLTQIGCAANSMQQDDAMGETLVFKRENASLRVRTISADELDCSSLEDLQQYEMIVFDGGNRHGDQWKHVFFPAQMRSHFVREDLEHNELEDYSAASEAWRRALRADYTHLSDAMFELPLGESARRSQDPDEVVRNLKDLASFAQAVVGLSEKEAGR